MEMVFDARPEEKHLLELILLSKINKHRPTQEETCTHTHNPNKEHEIPRLERN